MSSVDQVLNNGQQAITNYNTAKIFIFANRYLTGTYTNSTYVTVTLLAGTVVGRVSATGAIVPLTSAASDGSQYPIGILANDHVVAAGVSTTVSYCVEGDVAEEKVLLQGSDTLNTVISSRRLRDRIAADTAGIILKTTTEMTDYDNQ